MEFIIQETTYVFVQGWKFVSHTKETTQSEGVLKPGAEENIWI
jgi:hypothetical protein